MVPLGVGGVGLGEAYWPRQVRTPTVWARTIPASLSYVAGHVR